MSKFKSEYKYLYGAITLLIPLFVVVAMLNLLGADDFLSEIFIYLVVLVWFIFQIRSGKKEISAYNHQFQKIAESFGLKYNKAEGNLFHSTGDMEGKYRGFRIYGSPNGLHDEADDNVRFIIYLNSKVNNKFRIVPKGNDILTFGRVEFNDSDFNDKYKVTSDDETIIHQILDNQIIKEMLGITNIFTGLIEFENGELIYYSAEDLLTDEARENFEKVINVVFNIADKIENISN